MKVWNTKWHRSGVIVFILDENSFLLFHSDFSEPFISVHEYISRFYATYFYTSKLEKIFTIGTGVVRKSLYQIMNECAKHLCYVFFQQVASDVALSNVIKVIFWTINNICSLGCLELIVSSRFAGRSPCGANGKLRIKETSRRWTIKNIVETTEK